MTAEPSVTDARELIRRAKTGDRSALELLLTEERLTLIRRSLAKKLSGSEIEECHGEVVARIYRNITNFEGAEASQFEAWVAGIAHNVARELIRRKARDRDRSTSLEGRELDPGVPDSTGTFDNHAWLVWALEQIQPDYAKTLLLSVRDGLSHREIAKRLYISEATVATRIHRARQALKALHEGVGRE